MTTTGMATVLYRFYSDSIALRPEKMLILISPRNFPDCRKSNVYIYPIKQRPLYICSSSARLYILRILIKQNETTRKETKREKEQRTDVPHTFEHAFSYLSGCFSVWSLLFHDDVTQRNRKLKICIRSKDFISMHVGYRTFHNIVGLVSKEEEEEEEEVVCLWFKPSSPQNSARNRILRASNDNLPRNG
ncbi:hypothetical protein V1478_006805, partial [Vespula squamosa]